MKFSTKLVQRIFAIKLAREIFVGCESHHLESAATFNAQRSTSNAEFKQRSIDRYAERFQSPGYAGISNVEWEIRAVASESI